MNIKVETTSVTQGANEVLGTQEKTLYYLILGENENRVIINVGLKTHEQVKQLLTKKQQK